MTVENLSTADEEHLYDIRQKVGMVFQNPDNQIVATIVEEDVAFALENLGVPPVEIRTRIDEAMEMAGIYKHRNKAPHKLSGGQKQRVAIAGVIAMRPDCLVLDEATAMLDPRGREKVMKTIRRLNREFGITVVTITHYMEEAAQADRVLVMNSGHVVMEGTPKEVFRQVDTLHKLRLDVPQATELAQQLRAAGLDQVLIAQAERKPILGICLGMQLLLDRGEEVRECAGLGLVPGCVRKIETSLKLPHIGWNSLSFPNHNIKMMTVSSS